MKLTLKNFRCHINQTFEFDDDTITLITGPSGCGKTTILLAIQFALYGSINHKFLVSHNKVNCEVNLIYKNFKIKRTKRPNILTVNVDDKFYEDKEAQVILNKYFGLSNLPGFFMDLSHLEKMEFLEKIVNVNCDVKDLKNKIKTEISNLNKEMAVFDGQIANTESMLKIVQKPDKVEKPLLDVALKELNKLSKNEVILKKEETINKLKIFNLTTKKYNELKVELDLIQNEIESFGVLDHQIEDQIKKLSNDLLDLKVKNNHMNKLQNKMCVVEESLKDLKNYEHINDTIDLELKKEISIVDEKIEQYLKYEELQNYHKLNNEYNEVLNLEQFDWKCKVESLQNKINNIDMDKVDIDNLFYQEQIYIKLKDIKIFNSKHNLIEINDEIKALKLKFFKHYNCIKCNHVLTINMDTFQMVDLTLDEPQESQNEKDIILEKVKFDLNKLQNLKLKLKENNNFLRGVNESDLMEKITITKKYNELISDLNLLGSFKPSVLLSKMEKKLKKLKLNFTINDDNIIMLDNLDVLKDKRRDLTIKQNEIYQQLKIKNNLLNKIIVEEIYSKDEHQKIINFIESKTKTLNSANVEWEKVKSVRRLQNRYNTVNLDIEQLSYDAKNVPQLEHLLHNLNLVLEYHIQFDQYKSFQVQLCKYKKVKDTLTSLNQKKKIMEQTYLKTLLFKQKIIESEHESLQFMVNIINSHLSVLLQAFFSESFGDPIQIYLELENGKRPQINTIINYKGNKVDYKSLSTGEYARVKLAFDLTFKEILGENIIMLDECTANLDQDLSTKIFNKIKSTFPSKTILVVAHQVVMGTFDHILQL